MMSTREGRVDQQVAHLAGEALHVAEHDDVHVVSGQRAAMAPRRRGRRRRGRSGRRGRSEHAVARGEAVAGVGLLGQDQVPVLAEQAAVGVHVQEPVEVAGGAVRAAVAATDDRVR